MGESERYIKELLSNFDLMSQDDKAKLILTAILWNMNKQSRQAIKDISDLILKRGVNP